MNDSKELRELEKLSAGLAPKKAGCKMCRVILIASAILFIATLGLVLLESRNMPGAANVPAPRITNPADKSERIKALREYIRSKEGTTTSIIVKSSSK